jgi:hypothetical protein
VTAKKPTVLTHPDSKAEVETHEPELFLSQGWEEQGKKATASPEPAK